MNFNLLCFVQCKIHERYVSLNSLIHGAGTKVQGTVGALANPHCRFIPPVQASAWPLANRYIVVVLYIYHEVYTYINYAKTCTGKQLYTISCSVSASRSSTITTAKQYNYVVNHSGSFGLYSFSYLLLYMHTVHARRLILACIRAYAKA